MTAFPKPTRAERVARKRTKRAARAATTATVREACLARSDGRCEVCGVSGTVAGSLEMDHFKGGSGRRATGTTVENCWMLCTYCHHRKTNSVPTADWWDAQFLWHARRHRYVSSP